MFCQKYYCRAESFFFYSKKKVVKKDDFFLWCFQIITNDSSDLP